MKKYIVTGGAGFIGSKLTERLTACGNKVFVIDNLSTGFKHNIAPGAVFLKADISNKKELMRLHLPYGINSVYHMAAQSSGEASFDDPERDIDLNYKGTYNVLYLSNKLGCRRFLFTSSMSVYGDVSSICPKVNERYSCQPTSYYGVNKLASEKIIRIFSQKNDIAYTIFRLFSVYGPGQNMLNLRQGMVSIYLSYLLRNKPIKVKGSLERYRDFVYIEDVIDVLMRSENDRRMYSSVYNVGTGRKVTVRQLLALILRVYGKKGFSRWVNVEEKTPGDIRGSIADISKLKAQGWQPRYNLEEGLLEMKAWLEETRAVWESKSLRGHHDKG